jgi:hypothetical protein
MTIRIDERWTDLIHQKMESAGFESAEQVVEEAMRLLRDEDTLDLERLHRRIAAGMADVEAGRTRPFDEALVAHIKVRARQRLSERDKMA